MELSRICLTAVIILTVVSGNLSGYSQTPIQPDLVAQFGHSFDIRAVAISADGKFILTGGDDQAVILWDVATGLEIRRFIGHREGVSSVAFSPDGLLIVSSSADRTVRVWTISTGAEVLRISPPIPCCYSPVAFSPDGRYILVGSTSVTLYEVSNGKEVRRFGDDSVDDQLNSFAFSPDGRLALTASGVNERKPNSLSAHLWDVATGKEIRRFKTENWILSVTFSPDGRSVLTAGLGLRIWDVASGKEDRTYLSDQHFRSATYSPDGKFIISLGISGTLQRLDTLTGKIEWASSETEGPIWSTTLSGDGKYVLVGRRLSAHLLDSIKGEEIRRFQGYTDIIWQVAFSPDGRHFLTGGKNIRLWDLRDGKEARRFEGDCFAFSPDGHSILTGSWGRAQLWDTRTGKETKTFEGQAGNIRSVAFSHDGRFVASGSDNGTTYLWEIAHGKELQRFISSSRVNSIVFSPNDRFILVGAGDASATSDNTVRLWDIAARAEIQRFTGHKLPVNSVAFTGDGRFVITGAEDARLWDASNGRQLQLFPHESSVFSVAISADSETLLTGSADKVAHLWNVKTGKEIKPNLEGHTNFVTSVAFSPDGRLILTGGADNTTRLWRTSTNQEIARVLFFRDGTYAVVDDAGHFDTNDPDRISSLAWRFPDEPRRLIPIEIFMRDYYEPGMLSRLVEGEVLRPARSLYTLNRALPHISIEEIRSEPDSIDKVSVTVEISEGEVTLNQYNKLVTQRSGVYDLHLLRAGRVVGQWPEVQAIEQNNDGLRSTTSELTNWRSGRQVQIDSRTGKARVTFRNIQMPSNPTEFSAYAFNSDRIKSPTTLPYQYFLRTPASEVKRRAYIITVGVGAGEWQLAAATQSANLIGKLVSSKLSKEYDIIEIPLISALQVDSTGAVVTGAGATKRNINTVLNLLAGRSIVDQSLIQQLPNANKLRAARPDDLVLLYVNSPGYSDPYGNFFLIPQVTPSGISESILNRCRLQPDQTALCGAAQRFLQESISSDELSFWWKGVDAGEMIMILDANYSGGVMGPEFKPGPLGDRSFGQIAYDKGMRILTASKAEKELEYSKFRQQSLLSATLIKTWNDNPSFNIGEWLEESRNQLPDYYMKVFLGAKPEDVPKPVLYDFSRRVNH